MKSDKQVSSLSQQDQTVKPRRRIKKRWWVLGGILLVIVALVIVQNARAKQASNTVAFSETTVLKKTDLQDTIRATGTVASKSTSNVYSTLTYPITAVHVSVGDVVQEGDLLCEIERDTLEQQIEMKQAAMRVTKKSSQQQLASAQQKYQSALEAVELGQNATLLNAERAVQTAYDAWIKAKNTYDKYVESLNLGENAQLLSLDQAYSNAQKARDAAREAYDSANADAISKKAELDAAKKNVEDADAALQASPDDEALKQAYLSTVSNYQALAAEYDAMLTIQFKRQQTLTDSESALESARVQYNAGYRTLNDTVDDYDRAVTSAYAAYENALASQEAAKRAVQTELDTYRNSVESTKISASTDVAELELEQLENNLEKTRITAPVSGTVTAVYATVGATGSGLLFIIEDTDNLIVDTAIKEYDIATVATSMPVSIESDATGDDVYEGVITSIAPTSQKSSATAVAPTSGDVLFDTEVAVLTKQTGLRIGMTVRLNLIVDEQADVLAVPYDAVYENSDGQTCVLAAMEQENGEYLLQELPVTTGIENDVHVAISGDGVVERLRVINNPDNFKAGTTIHLVERVQQNRNMFPGMGMM